MRCLLLGPSSLQLFPQPSALVSGPWTARPGEVLSVLTSALLRELTRVLHSESCREQCSCPSGSPIGHCSEGQGQRGQCKRSAWQSSMTSGCQLLVVIQSSVWGLGDACLLLGSGVLLYLKCPQDTLGQQAS